RISRIYQAEMSPFVIRGAFLATFMNKYSGLPMALTGALTDEHTAVRIKETASFFTTATLPGALERFGSGFKAAAMVRLMHSMVRFNLLRRSNKWDVKVYGIPVPQVDQMPAGTIGSFLTAFKCVRAGRDTFTDQERAIVELNRYQCYLLGLPEDLLPDTPRGIFNAMVTYASTLRDGYDDNTLGELVRSTMKAYLPQDHRLQSRVKNMFERSFAKVFFNRAFLTGSLKKKAKLMRVQPSPLDYALFAAVGLYVFPRVAAHRLLEYIPLLNDLADKQLTRKINALLVEYGHAEYTTDASKYKEANAA
ncbi:MAG TPA: oxygenase MpaB family protein, partial [Pseudomonadales bacterium]|nr:oxygenase MpaB family protein [Pseudomonadales bacterium]